MEMQHRNFVDTPRLEITNIATLICMYAIAALDLGMGLLFPSQPIFFFTAFLIVVLIAPIHYCWINTTYELNDSKLRIRSGFYQKSIDLESIRKVRINRKYSPLAISPPSVKGRNRVSLTGKFGDITITPDKPAQFVKELQKRVPHLRVEPSAT
jgi:hypothetical protein